MGLGPVAIHMNNGAVPSQMLGPRLVIMDSAILAVGVRGLGGLGLGPFAGCIGHAHVDVEDRLQPARAAQLRLFDLAGFRVRRKAATPPALGLQRGRQVLLEVGKGSAARQCIDQRAVDIAQHIKTGRLRHGEGSGMIGLPHIPPVKRRRQREALGLEIGHRLLGRQALHLNRHGATLPSTWSQELRRTWRLPAL